ncbi:MAG TPA: DUF3426 domain-containing protein [Gammaproteobacteria bacterium]|nr:DUF3426 domain-containing protein [Gammaproteobacteria bacterium]
MFTRCPECRTVFHVSAAELRAAAGTVVCGACGVTFDALDSLSETRPAESTAESPADDTETEETDQLEADDGEPLRDEDAFLEELEALIGAEGEDEDEQWLPEKEAPQEAPEHATEGIAQEAAGEAPDEAEETPTGDETPPVEEPPDEPAVAEAQASPEDDFSEADFREEAFSDEDFPDPDAVFRVEDFTEDSGPEDDEPYVGDDAATEDDAEWNVDTREAPDGQDVEDGRAPDEDRQHRGTSVGEAGSDRGSEPGWEMEPEEGEVLPEFARDASPGYTRRMWLPLLLALVAALLLTGTWAHSQRGKLMRHPAAEAILAPVYSLLGMDAAPVWNPAEFRALKWEAVADPDRPGQLVVAVAFVNDASYAQPYPIIRVALQDRFGRPAGRHDFTPADYLESYSRGRRLPAGGRVQTTVEVPDPEGRAEGFRIDFCLQTRARGLVCGPELFR